MESPSPKMGATDSANAALSNSGDLRCDVCSREFDRRSRLEAHYKTHTGERPFSCPFCGKSFASKGNCNTHMRVHTRERPYNCPHCEKRFSQHGQLVIHIRRHTGEKPYICKHCNKGFTCSKVLKIHVRTHTGEKPFQCEYCQKGFAAYANLVVHRRIHTRERPYVCNLCGRAFEHSGNLSRHVRVHRVEGGVRCIPCGQVFALEQDLVTHTGQHHPNEIEVIDEPEIPPGQDIEPLSHETLPITHPSSTPQYQIPQNPPQNFQSSQLLGYDNPTIDEDTHTLTTLVPVAPSRIHEHHPPVIKNFIEPVDSNVQSTPHSDSEDSGRESGSSGYATSPDQGFSQVNNSSIEVSMKGEDTRTQITTNPNSLDTHYSQSTSPLQEPVRETLNNSISSTVPTIRMPPKKQQYLGNGGNRSPLSALRTALSTNESKSNELHNYVSTNQSDNPMLAPTIAIPVVPGSSPRTSGANSPHLNSAIHHLSLEHPDNPTRQEHHSNPAQQVTPIGLGAAPYQYASTSNPLDILIRDERSMRGESSIVPVNESLIHPRQHQKSNPDSNPLDLSQAPPSLTPHGTSPINLAHRHQSQDKMIIDRSPIYHTMEGRISVAPSSQVINKLPSVTTLTSGQQRISHHNMQGSHHLLTAVVPSSRGTHLRRKSMEAHSIVDYKKHKTKRVAAPPPLIPISGNEENSSHSLPNQQLRQSQPSSLPITSTIPSSHYINRPHSTSSHNPLPTSQYIQKSPSQDLRTMPIPSNQYKYTPHPPSSYHSTSFSTTNTDNHNSTVYTSSNISHPLRQHPSSNTHLSNTSSMQKHPSTITQTNVTSSLTTSKNSMPPMTSSTTTSVQSSSSAVCSVSSSSIRRPVHSTSSSTTKLEDPDIIFESQKSREKIYPPKCKAEDADIIVDSFETKEKLEQRKPAENTGSILTTPLESIRENIQRSLLSLLPTNGEATAFKRQVETALVVLVGETPMKQLGYPEKNSEQVLITILDMAGKDPCADVRVDELQRLRTNMRKFLEYSFPSRATWDELGWAGASIETIMESITSLISRRGGLKSILASQSLTSGPGPGDGTDTAAGEDVKVNGSPLKGQ